MKKLRFYVSMILVSLASNSLANAQVFDIDEEFAFQKPIRDMMVKVELKKKKCANSTARVGKLKAKIESLSTLAKALVDQYSAAVQTAAIHCEASAKAEQEWQAASDEGFHLLQKVTAARLNLKKFIIYERRYGFQAPKSCLDFYRFAQMPVYLTDGTGKGSAEGLERFEARNAEAFGPRYVLSWWSTIQYYFELGLRDCSFSEQSILQTVRTENPKIKEYSNEFTAKVIEQSAKVMPDVHEFKANQFWLDGAVYDSLTGVRLQ